eukprot:3136080-Rhodomonas_salina.1
MVWGRTNHLDGTIYDAGSAFDLLKTGYAQRPDALQLRESASHSILNDSPLPSINSPAPCKSGQPSHTYCSSGRLTRMNRVLNINTFVGQTVRVGTKPNQTRQEAG